MNYSLEIEGLVAYKHKLEAENERLRYVLAKVFEPEPGKPTSWRYSREECAAIARIALA